LKAEDPHPCPPPEYREREEVQSEAHAIAPGSG